MVYHRKGDPKTIVTTRSFYKIPFLTNHCPPERDWLRSQNRHFPMIFNRSEILSFQEPPILERHTQLEADVARNEKRHYFVTHNSSHLDGYF